MGGIATEVSMGDLNWDMDSGGVEMYEWTIWAVASWWGGKKSAGWWLQSELWSRSVA